MHGLFFSFKDNFYQISSSVVLRRERDEFEMELSDLKRIHSLLEAAHQAATKERDELVIEVSFWTEEIFFVLLADFLYCNLPL